MKVQLTTILLSCLLAVSCSEQRSGKESAEVAALERATALVSKLNVSIESDYPLAAAAWGGMPVITITVESAGADYMPTVERILEAVGPFEGELQLAVQTPMDVSESERASGIKDGMFIVAHFNAVTGERIP